MSKPRIVIWGASSQASVVADIIRQEDRYELIGFLDDVRPERHGQHFCGVPVLGGRDQLPALRKQGVEYVIIGIGKNSVRHRLSAEAENLGFKLATAIHPRAIIAPDAVVGPGSVVKAGASIDPNVRLGRNVIVGAGVTIAHDCILGDDILLSGGVDIAGVVKIGDLSWLGTGCKVKDRVSIGPASLVGTGGVVIKSIPEGVVAVGVPAKVAREVKDGEL